MADSFQTSKTHVLKLLQGADSVEALSEPQRLELADHLDSLRNDVQPLPRFLQNLVSGSQPLVFSRIAISMGIFDAFAAKGNAALSLDELDAATKGDRTLLLRLMRMLTVSGLIHQISSETWKPTPNGSIFASGGPPAAVVEHFYAQLLPSAHLDAYLATTNFANPTSAANGPWQYAYGCKEHFFDWLAAHPADARAFNTVMTINQQFRGQDWFDFFPAAEKLAGAPQDVLLVDIGGGVGHDISALKKAHPALAGKLILQDLPGVVAQVAKDDPALEGITVQAHDMFAPQPVKRARAYYLRTVLHDWPDADALRVLRRLGEAMDSESLLLLNENLMPEPDPSAIAVTVDFAMMTQLSSAERTEAQWTALLERAGFAVRRVWKPQGVQAGATALFEAGLA